MQDSNVVSYLRGNREKIKLVAYFVVILALAYPLAKIGGGAWERGNLLPAAIRLYLVIGVSKSAFNASFFGVFIGFLALMSIDPKKRVQAALLWFGLIVSLIGLKSMGIFLPNTNFIAGAPWLVGGVVVGVLIGGGQKLIQEQTASALEFRRASLGVYYVIAVLVVVALIEYHVTYPDLVFVTRDGVKMLEVETLSVGLVSKGIFYNTAICGLFLVTVRQFVKYDAERSFFILGPRASGKSLFLIGSYLEALERTSDQSMATPLNPSDDLMDMVQELDRRESGWIVEATGRGEVNRLAFQYVHGSVFPTNIRLESIDYAGEYLNRLPDAIAGTRQEDSTDSTLERLVEGVKEADTLILILDLERFHNDEPLEISEYFSILQEAEDVGVVLIATKADTMAEEFREDRGLEAHIYYDEFKDYINERLQSSQQVQGLVQETAGTDIYPVYYQTKVNDNGDRVPIRDESNSVVTVGFDRFLDLIGRQS